MTNLKGIYSDNLYIKWTSNDGSFISNISV